MGLRSLLTDAHPGPVHMVGIGGIGVSGVARILHRQGIPVQGSDRAHSPVTDELLKLGIGVLIGHRAENLPANARLVVRSAAVPDTNPEIERARALGIPLVKYAEALGALMQQSRGVAIAGTHGKTTTTAMASHILIEAGWDPTMVVGGVIPTLGGTSRVGTSDIVVCEACEFDRSFLHLRPTYAVVTNIEADHLDYYEDLDEIRGAFRAFAAQVPADGVIVCCAEDPEVPRALSGLAAPLCTYAIGDPRQTLSAEGLTLEGGRPRFTLVVEGRAQGEVTLSVPGRHNVLNALAALGVAHALGVPLGPARQALARFAGVNRRFQLLHEQQGVAVLDDYAHHPTEITATLAAARERFPDRHLVSVFQPHQHSRTRHLFDAFVEALAGADEVVIPDIYGARDSDEDRRLVSAADLVAALRARGVEAHHEPSFDRMARFVVDISERGPTAIVTAGAGDIWKVAQQARELLLARAAVAAATTAHPSPARPAAAPRPRRRASRKDPRGHASGAPRVTGEANAPKEPRS